MSLTTRLAKLEREAEALPTRRCPTCQGWANVYVERDPPKLAYPIAQPDPSRVAPAEVCPSCGWRPDKFIIKYGNWPPGGEPT